MSPTSRAPALRPRNAASFLIAELPFAMAREPRPGEAHLFEEVYIDEISRRGPRRSREQWNAMKVLHILAKAVINPDFPKFASAVSSQVSHG